jgi:hypothetical protein
MEGTKQKVISSWLNSIKNLGIHPEFVLTDKDQSEINAVRTIWPNSKHQLCFWHALRAVKQRLAKNKSTPAFYDATSAAAIFNFIDPMFLPQAQQLDKSEVDSFLLYCNLFSKIPIINRCLNLH